MERGEDGVKSQIPDEMPACNRCGLEVAFSLGGIMKNMKKRVALFIVSMVVVFVAGVLVQSSRPVPNRSRVPAVGLQASAMAGSLRSSAEMVSAVSKQRIVTAYGKLPLSFEANRGRTDSRVKFLSRGPGYSLFLTGSEMVVAFRPGGHDSGRAGQIGLAPRTRAPDVDEKTAAAPSVLRMRLAGANPAARVEGIDELPAKSNYFIGNDPAKWRTNVPHYAKVRYRDVYPGVDLVYYGNQQQVEHDFVVAPGADPKQIHFAVTGAERMEVSATGDLVMQLADYEVRLQKPVIYQEAGGLRKDSSARTTVSGEYALRADNSIGFTIGAYDSRKMLVIDPVLEYSTYLGGNGQHPTSAIAVDADGSAYLGGFTGFNLPPALDYPTTEDALQPTAPHVDHPVVVVSKLNPEGTSLVYSTYLGGSGDDRAYGLAVDREGNAHVVGRTTSRDFPTKNAVQPEHGTGTWNAFVAKLNPDGSALRYSTYLGGSVFDQAWSVAVDRAGSAYILGWTNSSDFPTRNPLQDLTTPICDHFPFGPDAIPPGSRCLNAFVTKLSRAGSELVYSTYLGGSGNVEMRGSQIAVDIHGNAYLAGGTESRDFPTTPSAAQPVSTKKRDRPDLLDAFVAKLNPTGSALVYSTYLGASGSDNAHGIAVDAAGNAYVAGETKSPDFPTTRGAFQTTFGGGTCGTQYCSDGFVAKLNREGSRLIYSTFLGGKGTDLAGSIAVDLAGNAYVAGFTESTDFPTKNALQPSLAGPSDAFVVKLNRSGSAVYSTYLGGRGGATVNGSIAVDADGNAFVCGTTRSKEFPTTEDAFQPTLVGNFGNFFVTKIGCEHRDEGEGECQAMGSMPGRPTKPPTR
jgi:hypothetical protein